MHTDLQQSCVAGKAWHSRPVCHSRSSQWLGPACMGMTQRTLMWLILSSAVSWNHGKDGHRLASTGPWCGHVAPQRPCTRQSWLEILSEAVRSHPIRRGWDHTLPGPSSGRVVPLCRWSHCLRNIWSQKQSRSAITRSSNILVQCIAKTTVHIWNTYMWEDNRSLTVITV